ncbi:MAG: hypothetical protein KVP17_002341 [Porospora cf. gigantea B]|uniref:uncharacterized protein n=1 Tax=Porospora cf. gigantea B TaxID=2853592 RepID=UPI003571C3B4|nr:MAG: hypothetical protein KVP17_002341 [Porospora cf. gigantea B]
MPSTSVVSSQELEKESPSSTTSEDTTKHLEDVETRNATTSGLLRVIGTGSAGLPPPSMVAGSSWPALPQEVMGIESRFFRKPQIVTDDQTCDEYIENFSDICAKNGWCPGTKKSRKARRVVAGSLLGISIVGVPWLTRSYKRVGVGEIAFVTDRERRAHILFPGQHIRLDPYSGRISAFSLTDDYITFGNRVHIVRVHPGEYVVAKFNDQYTLLQPGKNHCVGVHVFDDPTFEFISRAQQTDAAILAGPVNIITVPPGSLARVLIRNKPYILFEGQHQITSGDLMFHDNTKDLQQYANKDGSVGFGRLQDTFVFHSIAKIYLRPGEVRGLSINQRAVFLNDPGDYWFYSDQVEMTGPITWDTRFTRFSSLLRVYIQEDHVGIVQKADGTVELLQNGCHIVPMPTRFITSLPLTLQFRDVQDVKGITRDPMEVVFGYTFAYRIVDPARGYLVGFNAETQDSNVEVASVIDRAVGSCANQALIQILRSVSYTETASLDFARASNDENAATLLIGRLVETLRNTFGVEFVVNEFQLRSVELMDVSRRGDLFSQAYDAAKARQLIEKQRVEANAAMAKHEIEVTKRQKETLAEIKRLELDKQRLTIERQNMELETSARLDREKMESHARAARILAIAEAEAQAVRMKAEAEGFARKEFPDHTKVELARIASQLFKESNLSIVDSQSGSLGLLLQSLTKNLA